MSPPTPRTRLADAAALGAALTAALVGATLAASCSSSDSVASDDPPACVCELRSWRVFARARHLYASIECPPPYGGLSGVVEFTSEALRRDAAALDRPPRVTRMTPGVRLRPAVTARRDRWPGDRLEATYEISPDQARTLQRDVVFEAPYRLLGANSNAAMRASLESIGLDLPPEVLGGDGMTGDFPGVNAPVGDPRTFTAPSTP